MTKDSRNLSYLLTSPRNARKRQTAKAESDVAKTALLWPLAMKKGPTKLGYEVVFSFLSINDIFE